MSHASSHDPDGAGAPPVPSTSKESQSFRQQVLACGSERTLFLGEWAALRFELRSTAAPDEAGTEDWLLCARLVTAEKPGLGGWPALAELARCVYAEVEGLGRTYASIDSGAASDQGGELRFALQVPQHEALRAGADFGFGIDHPQMRVGAMVKRALRASLLGAE